jgi:hypothetical protein
VKRKDEAKRTTCRGREYVSLVEFIDLFEYIFENLILIELSITMSLNHVWK